MVHIQVQLGEGCLSKSFCGWDEHHEQKQPGEGRIKFILKCVVHYSEKLGQELKESPNLKAEAMGGCCLLAYFLWLYQPAFL